MTTPDAAKASSTSSRVTWVVPSRLVPRIGDLVDGKYRIERRIGGGAMGTVMAARHEFLQRDVALKFVSATSASPETLARFRNEARAVAAIQSEHVARVLDAGQLADSTPFIALELLEGEDLQQWLEERGPPAIDDAIDWTLQVLEGLAEAHALGIVHRDLKPSNLFLARRRDGTRIVKILDFGIAKPDTQSPVFASAPSLTVTASILGSPMYMAPEQLRDARTVDARADIWALGVVLYELLSGRTPYAADNIAQLMLAVLESAPPSLRATCPEVRPGLEAIVMRCLSRDPKARFHDVAELADALTPFGRYEALASARRIRHIVRAAGEWKAPSVPPRRPPRRLALVLTVAAIGAVTAAGVAATSSFTNIASFAGTGAGALLERAAKLRLPSR